MPHDTCPQSPTQFPFRQLKLYNMSNMFHEITTSPHNRSNLLHCLPGYFQGWPNMACRLEFASTSESLLHCYLNVCLIKKCITRY